MPQDLTTVSHDSVHLLLIIEPDKPLQHRSWIIQAIIHPPLALSQIYFLVSIVSRKSVECLSPDSMYCRIKMTLPHGCMTTPNFGRKCSPHRCPAALIIIPHLERQIHLSPSSFHRLLSNLLEIPLHLPLQDRLSRSCKTFPLMILKHILSQLTIQTVTFVLELDWQRSEILVAGVTDRH